jgi:hypothetical protein
MLTTEPAVEFPGTLLAKDCVIEDAEIAFDDIVVAEFRTNDAAWTFDDRDSGGALSEECENCK